MATKSFLGCALAAVIALVLLAERAGAASPADDRAVARILEALGEDQHRPAGEVFQNVRLLREVSAGDLLKIMQYGFGRSLNVRCSHCHVDDDWAADELRAKRAAREMVVMVSDVNRQLLQMRNLDTEMATVNCSTCHRGELRPAGMPK